MKRWIHSSTDVKEPYKEIPEGHKLTLSRSIGPYTVISYGEGWENGYHVEHTDRVGGKYIDKGTVSGYSIGDIVLWKYAPSDIGGPEEVTIKMAHIYPNGKVEYTVVDNKGDGHSTRREVLDAYNELSHRTNRKINSAKSLKQMDPWEVKQAGYKLIDTGYARKDEFESIKRRYIDKYGPSTKVYRVRSDTSGLISYEVYAQNN